MILGFSGGETVRGWLLGGVFWWCELVGWVLGCGKVGGCGYKVGEVDFGHACFGAYGGEPVTGWVIE